MIKNSWFEKVPLHWDIVPFGSLFVQRKEKNKGLERNFVLSVIKNVGVIPYTEKGNVGNKVSEDLSGYKIVNKGDFVLNSMNLYMGSVGVSDYDGVTSTAYIICEPSPNIDSSYYRYLIQCRGFQEYVGLLGKGIMEIREAVRWTALKAVHIPVPSFKEQEKISNFLDRETARIDQLIEKKRELIKTLEDKNVAIVTENIVQGGRDFQKISSTEEDTHPDKFWPQSIRDILQPVKLFCKATSSLSDKTDPNYVIQYIDIGNVSLADGVKGKTEYLFKDAPSRARQILGKNDVIISTVRTYLKACAYIDEDLPNLIGSTGFCVLRPNHKIYPKYLYRAVQSEPFISGVVVRSEGVSYPAVNDKTLRRLKIPFPDLSTQKNISDKIEQQILPLNEAMRLVEKSIDKLNGYKEAIVTEAVTGQLDIQAWQQRSMTDSRLDKIEEDMEQSKKASA